MTVGLVALLLLLLLLPPLLFVLLHSLFPLATVVEPLIKLDVGEHVVETTVDGEGEGAGRL